MFYRYKVISIQSYFLHLQFLCAFHCFQTWEHKRRKPSPHLLPDAGKLFWPLCCCLWKMLSTENGLGSMFFVNLRLISAALAPLGGCFSWEEKKSYFIHYQWANLLKVALGEWGKTCKAGSPGGCGALQLV